jgi:YHS domain-containing protein
MTAIDPVCGMEVDESTAEWKTTYQGQTYYFCAASCLKSFEKEPAKYAAASQHESHEGHAHEHDHSEHAGHAHSEHEHGHEHDHHHS